MRYVGPTDEDHVDLLVAATDPAEPVEPTEEAFDLGAPTATPGVVGPELAAVGLERDDGLIAQLDGKAACAVDLVGTVHQQRRAD